jgi:hypothetical protein
MKKIVFFLLACPLLFTSCENIFTGGGTVTHYYVYVAGDAGRTVTISYLERGNGMHDNSVKTETVTLPFLTSVSAVNWGSKVADVFLEVRTQNDSTTKAIIYDNNLLLADGRCGVEQVFYPDYVTGDCSYCKDLAKDSVMSYLKSIKYPGYIEFSKGETIKRVKLYN